MQKYTKEAPNGAILNGCEKKAVLDVGRRLVQIGDGEPVQVHGRLTWETLISTAEKPGTGLPGRYLNELAKGLGCRRIRPASRTAEHLNTLFGEDILIRRPEGGEIYYAWGMPVTILGKEEPAKFWKSLGECEENYTFTRIPRPIDITSAEDGIQIFGKPFRLTGMQKELGTNIPNSGGHYIPSETLEWLMYGDNREPRKLVALVNKTNKVLTSQGAEVQIAYMRALATGRKVIGYLWTSK